MNRTLERLRDENGAALVMVLALSVLLAIVSVTMIELVTSETTRSAKAVTRQTSFQAAEAGVDAYTSKLLEDHQYYSHQVAAGESTRRTTTGTLVPAGGTWTSTLQWTYPNGHDAWVRLANGYEYNLQIAPPDATGATRILAIGRRQGSTDTATWRKLDVMVRPSSIADYYRIVDGDVGFGSSATTNGQVYANGDIDHHGTASASLFAEGDVTGSPNLTGDARVYDHDSNPTIRSKIAAPIQFSSFLASLSDISVAAQNGGRYLYASGKDAWVLTFLSDGTFTARACNRNGSTTLASSVPTTSCTTTAIYPIPANGAIYSPQPILVSGQVAGRVTIGTQDTIYIAGDIGYVTPGQHVLGLVATNNVIVAEYAPSDLSWRAAVIAQAGTWKTATQDGSHGTMTFVGSAATADGGSMTMFRTRNYSYDDNLHRLPPPWFPVLQDSYTTVLFRELPPG